MNHFFLFFLQIAKVAVSLTTKAVKVAIQYAPVDDTVKDLVKAGADVVNDQVEAIPDSSTSKRVKTAGTSKWAQHQSLLEILYQCLSLSM